MNIASVAGSTLSIGAPQAATTNSLAVPAATVDAAPAAAVETTVPTLAATTATAVAAPMASADTGSSAGDAVVSTVVVSAASTSAVAAPVTLQVADDLYAALGRGGLDAAALAIGGDTSGQESAADALATRLGAAASAQADLDRLIWESDDSSWQDRKGQRLL